MRQHSYLQVAARWGIAAVAALLLAGACDGSINHADDGGTADILGRDGAGADDALHHDDSSAGDGAVRQDGSAPQDGSTSQDGATSQDGSTPQDGGGPPAISGLHVSGNQIVNGSGQPIQIRGVNRSGTEYACIQGWGFADGPTDSASLDKIASWKANAVRIPLNETCWLNINGVTAAYAGANYQQFIATYVDLAIQHGLIPIVELHWSAAGTQKATEQQPMPNQDHTPTFWTQVADTFKNRSSVIFEVFNEPYPDNNSDTNEAWRCWRDGGSCSGMSYQAAGMQTLVTAIRGTGATNVVLLGGVEYSNALSQWLTHKPTDATGNLGAAWHIYNFNLCNNTSCYDTKAGPVAQQVPVVATEIGEDDCSGSFITTLMGWLDSHTGSYLAWTWDAWGGCLALITDYNGTPNGVYGQTYRDHLLSF
jgi:endoglucanase